MHARRRSREEWARLVVAFERTRFSVAEFCARHELVERTFCWWRWRLGGERHSPNEVTTDVRLIPVDIVKTTAPGSNVVFLAVAGIEVRVEVGTDVGYIAALMGALRSRC